MKIMLAQVAPRVGEIVNNTRMICDVMQRAESSGCDVLVLPELAVTGYPPEDLLFRSAFIEQAAQAVDEIVRGAGETCVVFGHPRADETGLKNSATLAWNGKVIGVYDKQRLPNYGVFDECRYFVPGDGRDNVFNVAGWRIGVGICEDIWDDDLAAQHANLACDVWLNLNASPFHVGKQDEREALITRRGRMFAAPVVYVNPVGGQDEIVFDGGSHAVDGTGAMLLRAPLFETCEMVLDMEKVGAAEICPMPEPIEQIRCALVTGVRDYVHRNGCAQALIGLSGGIDSAVTAAIAVQALGADNVLGVLLPSRYSSSHSIDDAEQLAASLGMETVILPIEEGVTAVESILADAFAAWGKTAPDVTEENIQARIRGLLLMAVSNKTGRMLLSTGNKSEMAVGYATLYGDMAGGFAVLKDVYKTQVYELARHINRHEELIPENSITKPPSAELAPDQKDSDSLPEYAVLDAILQAAIEKRLGVAQIAASGFDRDEVQRVVHMLHAAEYKRRQAPPGVKITRRAFGRDRRYPITHGFRE